MRAKGTAWFVLLLAALTMAMVGGELYYREYLRVSFKTYPMLPPESVRFPLHFPVVATVWRDGDYIQLRNVAGLVYATWRYGYERRKYAENDGHGVQKTVYRLGKNRYEICTPTGKYRSRPSYLRGGDVPIPEMKCEMVRQLLPDDEKEFQKIIARSRALLASVPESSRGQ